MTILSRGGCLRMTLAAVWLTTQPRLQSAALLAVTSTVALRLIASLRASATVELISIEAFLTLCDCRNGRIEGTAIISSTAKMARVTSISTSVKPWLGDVRMAHFRSEEHTSELQSQMRRSYA